MLFDGAFAARAFAAQLPAAEPEEQIEPKKKDPAPEPKPVAATPPTVDAALQLLALFQREGRFVDFLEEDVA